MALDEGRQIGHRPHATLAPYDHVFDVRRRHSDGRRCVHFPDVSDGILQVGAVVDVTNQRDQAHAAPIKGDPADTCAASLARFGYDENFHSFPPPIDWDTFIAQKHKRTASCAQE